MKKETFENLFENDEELLGYYCFAGSLIKYGNDLNKAWEATFDAEKFLMALRPKQWSASQIVSFAANKTVEVVENGSPSDEGLEIRKYGDVWGMFKDGECIYSRKLLTGKCSEVRQFK